MLFKLGKKNFLFLSSIYSQIIGVFIFYIIGTYYIPIDYSTYSFNIALVSILSIFSTLRIENEILNPLNSLLIEYSIFCLILNFFSSLTYGILTMLITGIWESSIISFCFLFVYGINQVQLKYYNRTGMYNMLSSYRILQPSIYALLLILFSYYSFNGIIWAYIVSNFLGQSIFLFHIGVLKYSHMKSAISKSKIIVLSSKEHIRKSTLISAFSTTLFEAPNILLKQFGFEQIQGLFSFYYRLLNKPVSIVIENLSILVNSIFSKNKFNLEYLETSLKKNLTLSIIFAGTSVILFPLVLKYFAPNWLFDLQLFSVTLIILITAILMEPFKLILQLNKNHNFELKIAIITCLLSILLMSYFLIESKPITSLYLYVTSIVIFRLLRILKIKKTVN